MARARWAVRLGGAAVAVALVAAACGGGGTHVDATRVVAESATKTSQAHTAKLAMSVTATDGSQPVHLTVDGAVDLGSGDLSMKMKLGDLGLPGAGSGTVEVRSVGGVLYMDLGALTGSLASQGLSLPSGARWFSIDPKQLAKEFGVSGSTPGLDQTGLTDTFQALRGVSSKVTTVGTEQVRGTETTHYRVQLDPKKALDQVPASERAAAQQALKVFGGKTLPADVWIDGQGRVRKLTMQLDAGALDLGDQVPKGTEVSYTLELYDFGTAVDVAKPPADQTVDFMQLFSQMLGQLGSKLGSQLGGAATSALRAAPAA